ncbi:MAG: hypothetical protein CMH54_14615 [Myxococcales bacterium]|nr:hypothetical protein [Myxococcales bacterium]|tara:strand:+ start:207 stop:1709 length:1503 start_codon:yes stop_codon:yes gene_type:complete
MRVAILQIRRMPATYFFDTLNVLYAGDLRRDGHEVKVYDHNLAEVDSLGAGLANLKQALDDFQPEVLLFERVFSPALVAALREESTIAVGALHQESAEAIEGVDFSLPNLARTPVVEAINALAEKGLDGLANVPGLTFNGTTPDLGYRPSVDRLFVDFDLAYDLMIQTRPSPDPSPLRKHVFGNLGCPYRNAPNRTGFLDDIELPTNITARGCTFCDRPDYDRIRPDFALGLVREQLQQVRVAYPDLEQLILVDEYALRYVDRFVALLLEEGVRDIEIFFSARIDYIHKFRDRFEAAVEQAGGQLRLVMYLVGIENFSPMELWRFNKGVSVRSAIEGLNILKGIGDRQEHFRCEPSFGFIMFTPWTTPLDLYLNLAYIQRLDFDQWRQSAILTRLRLYRENALYFKALQEGLIDEDSHEGADASARYGYEAEATWRFVDPRSRAIYEKVYNAPSGEAGLLALQQALVPYKAEIESILQTVDLEDPDTVVKLATGDLAGAA